MSRVTLRPARRSDFETLCGEPPWRRVRAFAAERDGALLGVGGLALLADETWAAFLQLAPGAQRYRLALHKAGLRTMQEAERLRIRRVVAFAEKGNAAAEPWLARLGFEPMRIDKNIVWVWQNRK